MKNVLIVNLLMLRGKESRLNTIFLALVLLILFITEETALPNKIESNFFLSPNPKIIILFLSIL